MTRAIRFSLSVVLLVSACCGAQCRSNAGEVADRALHRRWRVEQDCTHPASPPRLVEVPWSADAGGGEAPHRPPVGGDHRWLVRAGMQVTLVRNEPQARMQLKGVALNSAAAGERVRVSAGWGRAVLCGVVRGPAVAELLPKGKGRRCGR